MDVGMNIMVKMVQVAPAEEVKGERERGYCMCARVSQEGGGGDFTGNDAALRCTAAGTG